MATTGNLPRFQRQSGPPFGHELAPRNGLSGLWVGGLLQPAACFWASVSCISPCDFTLGRDPLESQLWFEARCLQLFIRYEAHCLSLRVAIEKCSSSFLILSNAKSTVKVTSGRKKSWNHMTAAIPRRENRSHPKDAIVLCALRQILGCENGSQPMDLFFFVFFAFFGNTEVCSKVERLFKRMHRCSSSINTQPQTLYKSKAHSLVNLQLTSDHFYANARDHRENP